MDLCSGSKKNRDEASNGILPFLLVNGIAYLWSYEMLQKFIKIFWGYDPSHVTHIPLSFHCFAMVIFKSLILNLANAGMEKGSTFKSMILEICSTVTSWNLVWNFIMPKGSNSFYVSVFSAVRMVFWVERDTPWSESTTSGERKTDACCCWDFEVQGIHIPALASWLLHSLPFPT